MRARPLSLALIALGTAAVTTATVLPATAATSVGPSTVTNPYVLPVASGVDITSLLTVNDAGSADNGYEMVGIPDGLGAYRSGGDTMVLMNHELRESAGIVRAHGQKGAFVSQLRLDKNGTVLSGEDFITSVNFYQYDASQNGGFASTPKAPTGAAGHQAAFARFCSGFLSEPGQFLTGPGSDGNGGGHARGNKQLGYDGQIYFANEESGVEGRAFGVTLDGSAYQLPRLGLFSWENTIAAPNTSPTAVVMGNEDTGTGEVWIYAGTKTASGLPIDRAGLTNGRNHVLTVPGVTTDGAFRAAYPKGSAAPFSLQDIEWNQSGAKQNAEAVTEGGLALNRIEDGAFNPDNKNEYFFVTTQGGDTTTAAGAPSRDGGGLWKVTFQDVERPALGGTLELLLDGSESFGASEPKVNKPDNMMIDRDGNLLVQEDPGGNESLARILSYRISDGARGVVARFDAARFSSVNASSTAFLTNDEESSGIIQLKDGSYLFDAQIHTDKGLPLGAGPNTVQEYVENGQLLKMTVADFANVYTVPGNS